MKKGLLLLIFAVLLFFITVSVFSQERIDNSRINSTFNFRNRDCYIINNDPSAFWLKFSSLVQVIAVTDDWDASQNNLKRKLTPEQVSIVESLRIKGDFEVNGDHFFVMSTNNEYGLLFWLWDDIAPAVIMGVGPGIKQMAVLFFKIK
jgi:hypothetical protein